MRVWELIFVALIGVVLCSCLGFMMPIEIAGHLLVGWTFFLRRVGPQVSINWPDVLLAVGMLAAFAVGLHAFCRWLYRQWSSGAADPSASPRVWRVRWSAALVALLVTLFVAGTSMVGIAHQTAWMLSSKEPLVSSGAGEASRRTQSSNNLKQIGLGFQNHHDIKLELPPGVLTDSSGQLLHGWHTLLLPCMEQQNVYDLIDLKKPWNDPANEQAMKTRITTYCNPRSPTWPDDYEVEGRPATHYAGNVHILGGTRRLKFEDIRDGLSNTVLSGEAAGNFRPWGHPVGWRDPRLGVNRSPSGFGSPNRKPATLLLLCDGSVRQIPDDISPRVLQALFTPAGREEIPPDLSTKD